MVNRGVVYLPGVFDLFHRGHLNAIRQARKYGKKLIIGVQSDQSVLRQKGHLPSVREYHRAYLLRFIRGVNHVIIYHKVNQTELLSKLKPESLAVTEEYGSTEEQKQTLLACKQMGIKIAHIQYTKGISTTWLKHQIKSQSIISESKSSGNPELICLKR